MLQETRVLRRLDGEPGRPLQRDDDNAVQTRRVMAVTAEARHLHDESGVQYHATADLHAIVNLPIVRTSGEVMEIDRDSPLMTREMMICLPGSASATKSRDDARADGGAGQTRDRGHHSATTDSIEGEMIATRRVAAVAVVVMKGKGGHRLERRPESEV